MIKDREPLCPSTAKELLTMIEAYQDKFMLVAGGTDFWVKQAGRFPYEKQLIDLSGVADFKGINIKNDEIILGSLSTMTVVSEHPGLYQAAGALSMAAGRVGSWQIRNRATLGGNAAGASPAADTVAALAALGASVRLICPSGERWLPLTDFITGPNQCDLAPTEVISHFKITAKAGRFSTFVKLGSRTEVTIARLNLAVSIDMDHQKVTEAKVVIGTLGSAITICPEAQNHLIQQGLDDNAGFGRTLAAAVGQTISGRPTMAYKQSAAEALAQDALDQLKQITGARS